MQPLKIFLTLLIASLSLCRASAQVPTGQWQQVAVYGDVSALAETASKLYLLTAGKLYCYDKEYDETRFLTVGTDLSDSTPTALYASPSGRSVAVVYDNSNIDVLYDDGRRLNLPDIKNASLEDEKDILDLAFDPDASRLYAATRFGLVVFDLARGEVKESGVYHFAVNGLMLTPSHLIIAVPPTDNAATPYYSIAKTGSIRNFKNFAPAGSLWGDVAHWYPLDDTGTLFAATVYADQLRRAAVGSDGSVSFSRLEPRGSRLIPTAKEGLWMADADGRLVALRPDGTSSLLTPAPQGLIDGQIISARDGSASVWMADHTGLGRYRLADGSLSARGERYHPAGATSFKTICRFFPTADGSGFIAVNIGGNQNHPFGKGDHYDVPLGCDIISFDDPDDILTIAPDNATAVTSPGLTAIRRGGPRIYSPGFVAEDPSSPGTYYIGSTTEGIYVVRDNKVIAKWDADAGLYKVGGYRFDATSGCFDAEGNLWVGQHTGSSSVPAVRVLPAAKLRKDPASVTAADWLFPRLGDCLGSKDIVILHCSRSPMTFVCDATYTGQLVALYNGGTPAVMTDDRALTFTSFVDRDGTTFPQVALTCMAEDRDGQLWVGTVQGLFVIPTPTAVFDSDFRVVRPKIPRNDGTNLADYLLDGEKITAIAVDHANRKWIATEGSGLFLVSPSGDQILAAYTEADTRLPISTITALQPSPVSNLLYVGTLDGLYTLASSSSPARSDYSDVLAYPNPLTPDHTGPVTITGLMDASLVKIVDSSLHLVAQTSSEGGLALWDGCDMNGDPVRSGVYYVMASTSDSSASGSGADVVAKILVVR